MNNSLWPCTRLRSSVQMAHTRTSAHRLSLTFGSCCHKALFEDERIDEVGPPVSARSASTVQLVPLLFEIIKTLRDAGR